MQDLTQPPKRHFLVNEESRKDFFEIVTTVSGFELFVARAHTVVPDGALQHQLQSCIFADCVLCAVLVSRDSVGVGPVGTSVAHSVLISCTLSQHPLSGWTLAVEEAHVVILLVVISLFTLALAVSLRAARRLLHLVLAARPAAQALADVVPQLRERPLRTRRALAFVRRRAACLHKGSRGAHITDHGHAGGPVRVSESPELRGDAVNQNGAH